MHFEQLKSNKPVGENETIMASFKVIENHKEFFDKNFKKFICALESLLKKEYQSWFDSISSTKNGQSGNEILNQSFLKLIVFSKVAHIQLNFTGEKQEMLVFLRKDDGKIKVACLY